MTLKDALALAERAMRGEAFDVPKVELQRAHDRIWSSPVAVERYLDHIRALSDAIETAAE